MTRHKEYAKIVVNIDHHKSNTHFGDYNFVDPDASSTGEILYETIKQLTKIDLKIGCVFIHQLSPIQVVSVLEHHFFMFENAC